MLAKYANNNNNMSWVQKNTVSGTQYYSCINSLPIVRQTISSCISYFPDTFFADIGSQAYEVLALATVKTCVSKRSFLFICMYEVDFHGFLHTK